MTHELKTWPRYFQRILDGTKTFEVRENDRDFPVGDFLLLKEYDPEEEKYTDRSIIASVTYILHGGNFGLQINHCIMGININR